MTRLDWSPFATVADLPGRATVISFRSLPTNFYPSDASGAPNPAARWFNHHVAVIWDEDHDTRVLDALAYLTYVAPMTASRISAIGEHKGSLTVWAAWIDQTDWRAFEDCSQIQQIRDYWPVEVRELVFEPPPIEPKHTLLAVRDKSPALCAAYKPLQLDSQDILIAHIDALYPLGWWGARRRGETGQE
jgi:hypothetical protein